MTVHSFPSRARPRPADDLGSYPAALDCAARLVEAGDRFKRSRADFAAEAAEWHARVTQSQIEASKRIVGEGE